MVKIGCYVIKPGYKDLCKCTCTYICICVHTLYVVSSLKKKCTCYTKLGNYHAASVN